MDIDELELGSLRNHARQLASRNRTLEAENKKLREALEGILDADPTWDYECPNAHSQGCLDQVGEVTGRVMPTPEMTCPHCGTPIDDSHRKARELLVALKDNGEKE